jgi:glycine cleavage system aminomethyltransferase T
VTSGGYSPSLKKGIMLAMVDSDAPDELFVAIRDKIKKMSKIKGPFIPNRTLKGKAGLE